MEVAIAAIVRMHARTACMLKVIAKRLRARRFFLQSDRHHRLGRHLNCLAAKVTTALAEDPFSGHVFVFRRRLRVSCVGARAHAKPFFLTILLQKD